MSHSHDHSHPHQHGEHHHDHDHPQHWLAQLAAVLHLPGFTHEHEHHTLAADIAASDNQLGIRTIQIALVILGITTLLQVLIYLASGSVALLADTVHNLGDALNSIPLLIAFWLARRAANRRYTYGYGRAEDVAGLFIVLSIAFSAAYILWESFNKLLHPQPMLQPAYVALAAVIGFVGNELVALMQIRVGRQIGSEAMIADGLHARTDGFTSLAVLIAVIGVWLNIPILDPIVGLVIGAAIVGITWSATKTVWYRLMDAVDPALVERVTHELSHHPEIKQIERVQMRWIGHRLFVEMALNVDAALSIPDADAFKEHLREHLQAALPHLDTATIELRAANGA